LSGEASEASLADDHFGPYAEAAKLAKGIEGEQKLTVAVEATGMPYDDEETLRKVREVKRCPRGNDRLTHKSIVITERVSQDTRLFAQGSHYR